MIPEVITDIQSVEFKTQPSLNYKMILDGDRIINKCDKLEAMKQVIYKILMTERYKYFIYSWNYGIELTDLFGDELLELLGLLFPVEELPLFVVELDSLFLAFCFANSI